MRKSLIILVFASLLLASCSGGGEGITVTKWSVLHSQVETPAELPAGASWGPIDIPSMFRAPYPPVRGFQYVWLKGEFRVDGDPSRYFGIIPGRIYLTDSIYINGVFAGGYTAEDVSNIHYSRSYRIPAGALRAGDNTMLIRLGLYGREFGGIRGSVRILPRAEFSRASTLNDFIFKQIPVGVAVFLFGQMVFCLIFFVRKRSEKANLYSAALCFAWILYIMALFAPWSPLGPDFRVTFLWSCLAFVPIIFMMLIQSFHKVYLTEYNRVIIPLLAVITAAILSVQDTTSPWYMGRTLGLASMIFMGPFLAWSIYRVNRIKPQVTVYVYVFFGVFPGLFIAWDVVNYLWIYHDPPMSHTYTLPIFIVGIMILIIDDIIRRDTKLEVLYSQLAKTQEDEKKTVITAGTEQKLERVIQFLKENYTSDISREGLASAIGMSSDHMSRMFKAYTGKKINEYINSLRIESAVEKLTTTDEKIIDIAFAVGFESLATFNRAFQAVMNDSPSQYKKKLK
ncbi:MAG: helix-turn-helix transcriptional regulator [Spirochaetes bacterium]|nr:helix-turn-helix transcriptional regulator [Spirochaetota bacterium]